MTYFSILPLELIKELACYLDHSATSSLLMMRTIDKDTIWKYKIINELGYKLDETVLPLDQKYLEIKALTNVDIGCEVFVKDITILVQRAAKIKDKKQRDNILNYFYNLPIVNASENLANCDIAVLAGALESNNQELIEMYKKYLEIDVHLLGDSSFKGVEYRYSMIKLYVSLYLSNNKQACDVIMNNTHESIMYVKEAFKANTELLIDISDDTFLKNYLREISESNHMIIYYYMSLLKKKRYQVADFVYQQRLVEYAKNYNSTVHTFDEDQDVADLIFELIISDDIPHVILINDWTENINKNRLAFNILGHADRFFTIKNIDFIWTNYIEQIMGGRYFNSHCTIDELIGESIYKGLLFCHFDFVDWIRTKMDNNKFINYINQKNILVNTYTKRPRPDFYFKYIEKFLTHT